MSELKISMTPLVDVCMCLLIVFLVSGTLIIEPSLKVTPPNAVTNEENEETEKVIVYISQDNKFAVNESIVEESSLYQELQDKLSRIESKIVVIKADKNTIHANLLEAMTSAKKAGAKKITIATLQKT